MGLFQKLPEDPVEWAGLPSEPLPDPPVAERLPDSPAIDLGAESFPGIGSISISIPTELPAAVADGDGD